MESWARWETSRSHLTSALRADVSQGGHAGTQSVSPHDHQRQGQCALHLHTHVSLNQKSPLKLSISTRSHFFIAWIHAPSGLKLECYVLAVSAIKLLFYVVFRSTAMEIPFMKFCREIGATRIFLATNHQEENTVVESANGTLRSYIKWAIFYEPNVFLVDAVSSTTYYEKNAAITHCSSSTF